MSDLKDEFERNGYVVIKNIFKENELSKLRKDIVLSFQKRAEILKSNPPKQLRPGVLFDELPQVVGLQFNRRITDACREIFGDYYYVNDLAVSRNIEVPLTGGGWHIDAGSNFSIRYINRDLSVANHKLAKIGVYLQDEKCPYGASINLIPGTHRMGEFAQKVLNRILLWMEKIPWFKNDGAFRLVGAKNMDSVIAAGDCVIFDCRIFHRSSWGRKRAPSDNRLDEKDDKLTVYWEVGDKNSAMRFIKTDLMRSLAHEIEKNEIYFEEKPFSHYLRFKFPDDYPDWYVKGIADSRSRVAQLENAKEIDIARRIYAP